MIDAVFISDLHLEPNRIDIQRRLNLFLNWIQAIKVKKLYILGDFFYAWAGDDSINAWSQSIANQFYFISQKEIQIFYMPGNRDFLLGRKFAKKAGWILVNEPHLITLDNKKVLLVHGDAYCTKDYSHQRFRRFTRNRLFTFLFLKLPLSYRQQLVNKVRKHSENNMITREQMDVVEADVLHQMESLGVEQVIHGHTHQAGIHDYSTLSSKKTRYVLSDWDDNPKILCYDKAKGFYFHQM